MIRVSSAVSPDVAQSGTTGGVSPVSSGATKAQSPDQIELSRLAEAVPESRSTKIEALRAAVDSQSYLPPSLPVIRSLVSAALSRKA